MQSECGFGTSRAQFHCPTRYTYKDPFQFSRILPLKPSNSIALTVNFVETRVFLKNQFNNYFTIIYISETPQRLRVHWIHILHQWISIPKFHSRVGFQVSPQWNAFWRLLNTHLRDLTSLPKSLLLKTHNQSTESVINYWLESPSLAILPACYLLHPFFLLVVLSILLGSFVCQAFKYIVMIQVDTVILLRRLPLTTAKIFTFQSMPYLSLPSPDLLYIYFVKIILYKIWMDSVRRLLWLLHLNFSTLCLTVMLAVAVSYVTFMC